MKLVDDWRPTATLEVLKLRARLLQRIRAFFTARGVLEVDTPVLSAAGTTEANLHSVAARSLAPGDVLHGFLHTSPEFAMKRLLAAGSGSIYQICKVFRGGEAGRLHNPEFTLLEWYRIGYDYRALMQEVAALVTELLNQFRRFEARAEELSYREAFLRHAGLDPHTATAAEFSACAANRGVDIAGVRSDLDEWRDLLLTHVIERNLGRGRLTFLYDYPASQAALARVRPGDPPVAERFELYVDGIELANGFSELADAAEHARRFASDRQARVQRKLPAIPEDRHLLAALAHGLPECSGVALGIDRLVMLAVGATSISEVLAFPFERA